MTQQHKFLNLNRGERFKFLFYSVKENERFILNWIKDKYPGDIETNKNAQECIQNAFDFLEKIILPGIKEAQVTNKELMLNGMADDVLFLSEEVSELVNLKKTSRVVMALLSLEALYTCIIDCFFSADEYDEDNCPFHVILSSMLGNVSAEKYNIITPEQIYGISWEDLERLDLNFEGIGRLLRDFMDTVFLRIK